MRTTRGFTLIELLIVVAILGILSAIAVPNFLNAQVRAKVARVLADFQAIGTAIEMYRLDKGHYIGPSDNFSFSTKALFDLTTPLAYISHHFNDPFFSNTHAATHSESNFDILVAYGNTNINLYKGGRHKWHDAYILVSHGPDYDSDSWRINIFPVASTISNYSTSNGLQSNGDIHRFFGDIHSGCFGMDGDWAIGRMCNG